MGNLAQISWAKFDCLGGRDPNHTCHSLVHFHYLCSSAGYCGDDGGCTVNLRQEADGDGRGG